jgi:type VI secretion system protein ImpF
MAWINPKQPLLASVLDRLITEPDGAGASPTQSLRALKKSVHRDLENLLNTRRRFVSWPKELNAELDTSAVSYGLPDFVGMNLGMDTIREDFRRTMERTIRAFEPRFKSVRVELIHDPDPANRALRFRIDAVLKAEPQPEPISFDSGLDAATATFKVTRVSS